jgi:hypothetical protein
MPVGPTSTRVRAVAATTSVSATRGNRAAWPTPPDVDHTRALLPRMQGAFPSGHAGETAQIICWHVETPTNSRGFEQTRRTGTCSTCRTQRY